VPLPPRSLSGEVFHAFHSPVISAVPTILPFSVFATAGAAKDGPLSLWDARVWRCVRSAEDPVEASLPRGLLLGVSGFLVTALADDPLFYSEGQVVLRFVPGIGATSFATAQ